MSLAAMVREALSYRNTWLLFLASGAFSGIVLAFAGLWGVPFLVSIHGFSVPEAAATASAMLIAWSIASIGFAPLSERIGRRKPILLAGLVLTIVLWAAVILAPPLPRPALVALILCLGIATGVLVLFFAFAKESVPARLAGTASGIANMGVMLGGMVMQTLVGVVLARHLTGKIAEGVRVYDLDAYRWGFAAMLAWCVLSIALLRLTKGEDHRALR